MGIEYIKTALSALQQFVQCVSTYVIIIWPFMVSVFAENLDWNSHRQLTTYKNQKPFQVSVFTVHSYCSSAGYGVLAMLSKYTSCLNLLYNNTKLCNVLDVHALPHLFNL